MKSLSMDSLSMLLDSVKILYIGMYSYDLNIIIGLLRCFRSLENLYMEVMISCTLKDVYIVLELTVQLLLFRILFFQTLNVFNLHVYLGTATTWRKTYNQSVA